MSGPPEGLTSPRPQTPAATRRAAQNEDLVPLSLLLGDVSSEEWDLLVSHARARLFEDPEEAEDLVQALIADGLDGGFDSAAMTREKFLAFLKAVIDKRARKVARERRRRQRRQRQASHDAPASPGTGSAAFQETFRIRLRQDLAGALNDLPKDQRSAVVRKHLQGRATAEIAHLEGVSQEAVRQRLARGRAKLRALLSDWKSL